MEIIIFALALRAFLFEIKFGYVRYILRQKHELFEIFLDCCFCNGFWCGLFVYNVFHLTTGTDINFLYFLTMLFVGLTTGFLSYVQCLITKKLKD